MKRFFWIPFCLLLALFGAALLNAAVADGLVTDWCAALDKLQDTAQAENWDSVFAVRIKKSGNCPLLLKIRQATERK